MEGLLYEKMRKFGQELDNEFTAGTELETYEEKINKVLDETKQEFPKPKKIAIISDDDEDLWDWIDSVRKWFEKWFGDSK